MELHLKGVPVSPLMYLEILSHLLMVSKKHLVRI